MFIIIDTIIHISFLFQCAVKLQKIMQEKVQELLEFDQVIYCDIKQNVSIYFFEKYKYT